MKAVVYQHYGSPDVLTLNEMAEPHPGDNEVLVKVCAASINSWDWDMVRGRPFIIRMWGLSKPRYTIPGADIAGVVHAVGPRVRKFKVGDEVFGDLCECGFGGFAEYACAKEDTFALKPATMTFEEAAAIPQAGIMALQSLRDKGKVRSGHKILLNGAGGGVGTFAVQIAKSLDAEVTVVDSGPKLARLKALGADYAIDYQRADFTENGKVYDLIVDVVSNRPITRYKRSLSKGGVFVMIGGTMSSIFQGVFLGKLLSMDSDKTLSMLAYKPNKDLALMSSLFNSGEVIPVIDRVFLLHETADAFRYYVKGDFVGKIVIKI